jgi:hypothetical protein
MKWQQILNSKQFPLGLLCVVLLPFFFLAFFTFPVSDDYAFFADTQTRSFTEFLGWGYTHLSGRYTAIAVTKLFNPLYSHGFLLYRLFVVLIFIGFNHSAYLFLKQGAKRIGIAENTSLIAVIMLLYWWLLMPNVCELIYWYSSAYSYTIGLIGLLYWGYLLLKEDNTKRDKWLMCLLPVIIAGTCEAAGFILLVIFLTGLAYHLVKKIQPPRYYYAMLCAGLLASAISLFSPGNIHRHQGVADLFTDARIYDFGFAIAASIVKSTDIIIEFFLLNLFTLFIVFVLAIATPNYKPSQGVTKLAKYMLFGSLGIVPLLLFPYYWSMGVDFLPLRIVNYAFVAFSILYIPALFIYYKPYFSPRWQQPKVKLAIVVVTFVFIGLRSNLRYAVTDLANIKTYKQEVVLRYKTLEENKGKDVEFSTLSYKPNTILHVDIDAMPGHWYNRSLAKYYGVKSISLKK